MGYSLAEEHPALLQLQKWGPLQSQPHLSEFREAFISPTRQLLLLLSYQCEAMLLPLLTGCTVDTNSLNSMACGSGAVEAHDSSALTYLNRSNLDDSFSSPSKPLGESNCEHSNSGHFFIADVTSLAWAACSDTNGHVTDAPFKDVLFVCGSNGVTVHAFCQHELCCQRIDSVSEPHMKEGRWIEWAPHVMPDQNMEMQESYSSSQESSGGLVQDERRGAKVSGNDNYKHSNDFSCTGSKRWLRSFFMKAETVKSEGSLRISLPVRSSFPHSARVVSFSIFGNNLAPADSLAHSQAVRKVKVDQFGTPISDLVSDSYVDSKRRSFTPHFESDVLSSFLACGGNCFYSCSRVFPSHSCNLIGFVLSLVDSVLVGTNEESNKASTKGRCFVVVASLDSWGVQLISSVELSGHPSTTNVVEWTDFCFSEDLLVCLTSSGLTSFYDVVSGEHMMHLDIVQSAELFPQMGSPDQGEVCARDGFRSEQDIPTHHQEIRSSNSTRIRRRFKRLVGASNSSLFAAVDEAGVTYVICAGKCLTDEYYSSVKQQPPFQYAELGTLVGLEIASADIGCQMAQIGNSNGLLSHYASCSAGVLDSKKIDKRFCDLGGPLSLVRHVFVPTGVFSEDDCLCFSSLGITRLVKRRGDNPYECQIVHHNLHFDMGKVCDDKFLNSHSEMFHLEESKLSSIGEVVGCSFRGCLYLVTQCGLSVVLPSVSSASYQFTHKSSRHRQFSGRTAAGMKDWEIQVLDRVILYEGPEVAEVLCLENGWDLKVSRKRRLQMLLDYLKFDDIERSLEMLADVGLAEEGILRIIFRAAYLMFGKVGSDNELSAASRLLALASSFATKLIRMYGLLQQKKISSKLWGKEDLFSIHPDLRGEKQNEKGLKNLQEMAHLLEITRNLQSRLVMKSQRPGQGLVQEEALSLMDTNALLDEYELSMHTTHPQSLQTLTDSGISSIDNSRDSESMLLAPIDHSDSIDHLDSHDFSQVSALVSQEPHSEREVSRTIVPLENPKEMVARWETGNLDLKAVVKDALFSGRLPLAVLQLHLHRSRDLSNKDVENDAFNEVREAGRAVAYDMFLKGETRLAIATLQRLGEDIRATLKQLAFGTTRRSLRLQIVEEMEKFGYLGPYEWKILERISLIERLYPSTSFWRTYLGQQEGSGNETEASGDVLEKASFPLVFPLYNDINIECGEIDGIVLGTWMNISTNSSAEVTDNDGACVGFWAASAIWSSIWDQTTVHRIVLDQPFLMGVHVPWDSQLEYHICHNEWEEVAILLDLVPSSLLSNGTLQISLDVLQPFSDVGYNGQVSYHTDYPSALEELDTVCIDVPDIKVFRFSNNVLCSSWLRTHMEQYLAKRFIFLREFWESTSDIVPLLARSGYVTRKFQVSLDDGFSGNSTKVNYSVGDGSSFSNSVHGLHGVLIRFCAQHSLPNLLDLFLDHHELALDSESLQQLLETVGDCQWAKWLLYSRVKGQEYEASFSNARVIAPSYVSDNIRSAVKTDEFIYTIDDIAEGRGEFTALATLMYAPTPVQNCLSTGSMKMQSSSAQCTLENLRPTLQHFPTLWRTFMTACLGQDPVCKFSIYKGVNGFSSSALSEYLNWRENIFCSSDHDTSLMQMLPCWFPKAVRRLIQLYIEDPLGWQSLAVPPVSGYLFSEHVDLLVNHNELTEISEISWEATIQRHIEEELFDSSPRETGLGFEHHLHRGRALAAFNHFLGVRIEKLKLENHSGGSVSGQANIQSDVQTLLSPLTESEESLLSSVMPLAVTHFENPVLVASCAFLLELCGLSTSMLRVDIAALRRISSFYKSLQNTESNQQQSPRGSTFHAISKEGDITESLARVLADEYLHHDYSSVSKQKEGLDLVNCKRSSRSPILVLHHLEKASLPLMVDQKTSGSWLHNGNGNGNELRSQQKAASRCWNLVIEFCQVHHIPLSTKYLAVLARDNDWVGFLSESQIGGYPFDVVMQVASKEFSDPRLKLHILTVLKKMQLRRKNSSSSDSVDQRNVASLVDDNIHFPVELFAILADCEQQTNPGEALLIKAKDLSWSILAMIASCFPDVTPLACLTVWLEITAARETSSIKVNDIASQIADNVASAVEACNSNPVCDRAVTFHYNRRIPKRRRLMETVIFDSLASKSPSMGNSPITKVINEADENKVEIGQYISASSEFGEGPTSLSRMVAVLCEQGLFLPLLRAFEMFLPSCSLLPFIRALQAFSQMRLSEASAHLGSFSVRIKEESAHSLTNVAKEENIATSWISSTAVKAADAVLSSCPSPYEKRCLLQLLAATDFGDGGIAAVGYRRLYWKINLAEPSLRKDDLHLGNETLDDASLLTALENNGHWEQARNWARQLEATGGPWKSAVHHVTETQAESMVAEWMEFLWDVPEERVALWGHCQRLFIRYSFPPLQAGQFFLKHAETIKELPAKELHELLLLSLQWLSGMITASSPVYPLHLLREIETRVWLLAVESEAQLKSIGDYSLFSSKQDTIGGSSSSIIDKTATIIMKMDNHINAMRNRTIEKHDSRDYTQEGVAQRQKRRVKASAPSRRSAIDSIERSADSEDASSNLNSRGDLQLPDNSKLEVSLSRWEERVGAEELERAVLSLLEFGQISAAKQLQYKLSPDVAPSELFIVNAALKLAAVSTPCTEISMSVLDDEVCSVIQSYNISIDKHLIDPIQILERLTTAFTEGRGQGLCRRIIAIVRAANVLGLSFSEAFSKQPIEVLQLLSLKAQESLEEAKLLVRTHSMPSANIARILAESFLKGLLAAHRGGYIDSQQEEEGPAPLMWRSSDFLKWAELCPSEPEIGHALMRLVITGQEIPHTCEVELLILSHHFYKSSACLDGVDVLVALAANKVDSYVLEGDFSCLARLLTGVGNFYALNFILGILIENGQLDLLLQKYSAAADINSSTAESVRGFRMAVLTSLKQFNPNDVDAVALVYNHFDMKHEAAALLETMAEQSSQMWFLRYDKDQNEDLLESMRLYIEAAEVHYSIDAGNKTRRGCALASLVSLQIRMPDLQWLNLTETNARRALVDQSRFQEALIVAEAYNLNQPSEWAPVLWNQMMNPELIEEFVADFVAVLPLQPSMLSELTKFYRAEMAARGDQSQFSVWLTGGGLSSEWAKYLPKSFRCLLKRTRDLRLRLQMATAATGFTDVINSCLRTLDRVPETAGPLVLRRGHGGAYLPLM
ncbi:hypothetical protein SAY86_015419 [Trapa natans]|uniref:Spatacsin C-terminal domain-containing protein n=1 Tax=Trapa natans TaxID=22666 RepID=A0AAN7KM51_TRANT|nr:hypothetical protein SAY86_015419 [Trapa natans]